MLVCQPKKIIFVQIPGAECDSLNRAIASSALDCHKEHEFGRAANRYPRFAESLPLLTKSGIDCKDYFKLVLVRNPYHRLIDIWQDYYKSPEDNIYRDSLLDNLRFTFARHTGLNPFPAQEFHQMYPEGDFRSFIFFLDDILSKFRLDLARKYIGAADQYSYIDNDSWTEFDYIASYETLNLDIANLNQKFDLKIIELLCDREQNQEEQMKFAEFYDEETLKIVNRLFIRDFVYFGYEKMSLLELERGRLMLANS